MTKDRTSRKVIGTKPSVKTKYKDFHVQHGWKILQLWKSEREMIKLTDDDGIFLQGPNTTDKKDGKRIVEVA